MKYADTNPDQLSNQPAAMNTTAMTPGLQPAAHIYDPRPNPSSEELYACSNLPLNHLNLQQERLDTNYPFLTVYQEFNSVSLSAIQSIENSPCNPNLMDRSLHNQQQSAFNFNARRLSPDSPNESDPGKVSSTIGASDAQPRRAPIPLLYQTNDWSGPMASLSLEQPYQLHTFMANRDGTISGFAPTSFIRPEPTMISPVETPSSKRSADTIQDTDPRHIDSKGKRRCIKEQKITGQMCTSMPAVSPQWEGHTWNIRQPSPLAEMYSSPKNKTPNLRPRRGEYLPDTPPTISPPDTRRAISAAARAQSITEHVLVIYREYAKPKSSATNYPNQPGNGATTLADEYAPVLPAFPDLPGDELMLSDDDDQGDMPSEELSPPGGKQLRGMKKSSRGAKAHDKVSNRIAARRHREMTKERLKNLEKLRTWLDQALTEYEKSSQRLHDTFYELQEENKKQMRLKHAAQT